MKKDVMITFRATSMDVEQLNYLLRRYNINKADLIRHLINMEFKKEFIIEHHLLKK